MYCPYCGAAVESCPAFCSACGKSLKFLKNVCNKVPDENQQSRSEGTLERLLLSNPLFRIEELPRECNFRVFHRILRTDF